MKFLTIEEKLRKEIGDPAAYEGLAEEAAELAHAALKLARILRGENPTPVKYTDAQKAVIEELSDLWVYAAVLGIGIDGSVFVDKEKRMIKRLGVKL